MGKRVNVFRPFAAAWICAAVVSLPLRADLLLHYDFNDDSDPQFVIDNSGNDNDAEVMGAAYTEPGMGRSGEDDDLAMDFQGPEDGAHINVLTALDGAFETINENDSVTIAMWLKGGPSQPHNNSVFWFSGDTEQRILQAHVPWSNTNIYFDVGGCCDASQRINAPTEEVNYKGRWNHYAFVKDEAQTRIYQNGELFLESAPDVIASIEFDIITNVDFGAYIDGASNSYNGLMDDVYVYDEALDEEEIQELATSGRDELVVSPTTIRMREAEERQLMVTLFAADGTITDVSAGAEGTTYSADPADIVSISADGLLTGLKEGETMVTVKNGDLEVVVSVTVLPPPEPAELLLYYNFNDDSDPEIAFDQSGNDNDGEIFLAQYSEDGEGFTGDDGDLAMDFLEPGDGAFINVPTALDGAFDAINQNDAATITMWIKGGELQPVNNSTFWFAGDTEDRVLQAHIPWSNENIYFDVGGCCNADQRINAPTTAEFYRDEWNHYAFVKDESQTRIYQNGELFLESAPGVIASIEQDSITEVNFGSARAGGNSYNGLIDEIGVWSGALTQDEIQDVMEEGVLPPMPQGPRFTRGDANADGAFNISDGTFILNALFAGGPDPTCADAADANSDLGVNIADGVYVLNALFGGGDQPAAPFPDCGIDPDASIGCESFAPCP